METNKIILYSALGCLGIVLLGLAYRKWIYLPKFYRSKPLPSAPKVKS